MDEQTADRLMLQLAMIATAFGVIVSVAVLYAGYMIAKMLKQINQTTIAYRKYNNHLERVDRIVDCFYNNYLVLRDDDDVSSDNFDDAKQDYLGALIDFRQRLEEMEEEGGYSTYSNSGE